MVWSLSHPTRLFKEPVFRPQTLLLARELLMDVLIIPHLLTPCSLNFIPASQSAQISFHQTPNPQAFQDQPGLPQPPQRNTRYQVGVTQGGHRVESVLTTRAQFPRVWTKAKDHPPWDDDSDVDLSWQSHQEGQPETELEADTATAELKKTRIQP